ncbi:HNH endonuclease [Bacterioplanoides sp.]|uniref:HNH endonuclease n=1 Tax=Bacterioplanoides sp. TaxID=2066072 RepID=UPI003AFF7E68
MSNYKDGPAKEKYQRAYNKKHADKQRARMRNRYRIAVKKGSGKTAKDKRKSGLKILKGKDIDHKDGNALNNKPSNLQIMPASKNRAKDNNKK